MISTPSDALSTAFAAGSAPGDNGGDNSGNNGAAPAALPENGENLAPQAGETPPEAAPEAAKQPDPFAQRLREHDAEQQLRWREQVNQWRKEATEDPQIGGVNLPASVARAQLALDRFDDGKRIGQLLEQTGYGNNPDVLRFFNRVADALMEDGMVRGQSGSAMPPLEERMYAGWSSRR